MTGRTYTTLTLAALVAAVALDVVVLDTGLLRRRTFWMTMGIMWFFQIFVDGWLTRGPDPIVVYDDLRTVGVRVFFDTPVEDFGFGFALILASCSVWSALGRR